MLFCIICCNCRSTHWVSLLLRCWNDLNFIWAQLQLISQLNNIFVLHNRKILAESCRWVQEKTILNNACGQECTKWRSMETGKFALCLLLCHDLLRNLLPCFGKQNKYVYQILILLLMIVIGVLETVWYYSFMTAGEIPIHSNEIRNVTIAMNFRKIESNL